MQNVSGFGFIATVMAHKTFPSGFPLTQFADDADPFDVPSLQIADKGMGLNGDLVHWSKTNPINISFNVIPGSDDDENLRVLFEANRAGKGKKIAYDKISVSVIYPGEVSRSYVLVNGCITDGTPTNGVQQSQRQKTKTYNFSFENVISS
jgi:hypothetical protein